MIDTPIPPQTSTTRVRARLPITVAVALALLAAFLWAIAQLSNGIELRSFQQQIHYADTAAMNSSSIGQSFRSPDPNISRIELQLLPPIPQSLNGNILLRLTSVGGSQGNISYSSGLVTNDHISACTGERPCQSLTAAQIITDVGGTYLSIPFPPFISASESQTYTLSLETPGSPLGQYLHLGYSPVDALSTGQLYAESAPQPGDLAITAYYRYTLSMLLADIWNAISTNLLLILSVPLLLLLPGLALLAWLPNDLTTGQRLLAAPALTALSLPLLFLYGSLVTFTFGPTKTWLLLAISALAIALRLFFDFRAAKQPFRLPNSTFRIQPGFLFWLSLILLIIIAAVTRLLSLRGLQAGVGMDAYHHTMLADLFVHTGTVPNSYLPYAPLDSFTYHFGFHTLVAAVALLSGHTTSTDLMLLMPQVGQLAGSVLIIPSLALFGWKVLGNRWIGLVAAGLAALVSVVSAYYVEWSRFTQGLGLAVLPVTWVFLLSALQPSTDNRPTFRTPHSALRIPLAVIAAAGLFLAHYRIAIIYIAFAGLYLAWQFMHAARHRSTPSRFTSPLMQTVRAALVGILSLLVLSPWLLNLSQNFVKNFIDTDVVGIDVYFATAERLSTNVLNHPSLPILAALSAVALAILGWKETHNPRLGVAIGSGAGTLVFLAAILIYLNRSPVNMEHDLQTLFLGLSAVTWLLLIEIVALAVLLWLSKTRGAMLLLPALAWLVLALWSSPQLFPFRLPFVGYLDAVTLASGAWLPAVLLCGYSVVTIAVWLWQLAQPATTMDGGRWTMSDQSSTVIGAPPSIVHRPSSIALAAAILVVALLVGLASSLSLAPIHDRKLYVTQSDDQALLWMRDNLPKNSYVLANWFSFPWSPDQVLGSDSGLWIPFIAGARSSVEPIPAYNEQPIDPQYFDKVLAIPPLATPPADPSQWQWDALKSQGITHIYIGSRAAGAGFSPQQLLLNKNVKLVYHKDDTWLFQII